MCTVLIKYSVLVSGTTETQELVLCSLNSTCKKVVSAVVSPVITVIKSRAGEFRFLNICTLGCLECLLTTSYPFVTLWLAAAPKSATELAGNKFSHQLANLLAS